MTGKNEERRGSKRILFSQEEGVTADLRVDVHTPTIRRVILLSIGIGGMSFFINRQQLHGLKVGNQLNITNIQLPPPVGLIDEIEGEIRYIIDYDKDFRIAVGIEFTDIRQLHRKKIFDYVNECLSKKGV